MACLVDRQALVRVVAPSGGRRQVGPCAHDDEVLVAQSLEMDPDLRERCAHQCLVAKDQMKGMGEHFGLVPKVA